MCTQYTNNNEIDIEVLRKRKHEHSTSTFVKLFAQDYKKTRNIKRQVVVIQSVLCEDALHVNRRGFKISAVQIKRTSVIAYIKLEAEKNMERTITFVVIIVYIVIKSWKQ